MSNLDVRLNKQNVKLKFSATLKWTFLLGVGGKRGWVSELYTLCKTLIDDGAVTSHGSKKEGRGVRTPCCMLCKIRLDDGMLPSHSSVCVCVYSLSAAAGIWTLFP